MHNIDVYNGAGWGTQSTPHGRNSTPPPPPPPHHHHYEIIDPSLINNVDVLKWLKYSEFYIDSLFNITVL